MLPDPRETLSDNLRTLLSTSDKSRMDQSYAMEVPDGTLGRILYKSGNPTLDSLLRIAAHFRKEPWQLLAPNLGADLAPVVSGPEPAALSPAAQSLVTLVAAADTSQSVSADAWKHLAAVISEMVAPQRPKREEFAALWVLRDQIVAQLGHTDEAAQFFRLLQQLEDRLPHTTQRKESTHPRRASS